MQINQLQIASILGTFVLLTACSTPNLSQEKSGSSSPTPSAFNAPVQAQGSPVAVKLSEFKIDMPAVLTKGETTFSVTNVGHIDHNFEIQGNGLERKFDINLKPGETKTLAVNLSPGQYQVYCPVDSHLQSGMEKQLTVN